jgi:potassium-dependent mechanosensitive channel
VVMPDGNLLVIPNSYLVKNMVINHSYPDSRCRIALEIEVAPDTNPDQMKKLMLESARENTRVLRDPAPSALFTSLGSSGLTISMTCFVRSFLDSGTVTDEINSVLTARLRQAGIRLGTRAIQVSTLTEAAVAEKKS